MSKLKALDPTRYKKRAGHPVLFYIEEDDLAEACKIIGGNKIGPGVRQILNTYKKEIMATAKRAKK